MRMESQTKGRLVRTATLVLLAVAFLLGLTTNLLLSVEFFYSQHQSLQHVPRMMNQAKQTGARAMQITMLSQVVTPTSATTIVTVASDGRLCRCELVSVDCLDSMNCMPESLQESQTTVARGMLTRTVIQEISKKGPVLEMEPFPVGKQFQYVAMDAWTAWTEDESLSVGFGSPENSKFLQNTGYPDCIKNGWAGSACFFAPPANNSQDMGTLELEAQPLTDGVDMESLRQDVNAYLDNWQSVPALGHLMTFVHILRIFFNRRSHVQDFCRDRQVTHRNFNSSTDFPLSVSMHIRRADSCSSEVLETKAAPLDSPAQPTNLRKCYNTKVYIDAVQDVQSRTSRPIEVYLSSDHSGSLLEEIRRDFPDMYKNVAAWHVLDYNRTIFQYKGPVEGSEHSSHAILGESAIADLWLLSHGEVFIGHMGSRFGKLGWFLATARYNRFIPFRTVDGHSVCCEIDEACHSVAPYIRDMENCLTWAHERSDIQGDPKLYWTEVGSIKRIKYVKQKDEEQKKSS